MLLTYSAIMPINNFTSDILQMRYGLTDQEAGDAFGTIYFTSGFIFITVGYLQDIYG